ncbi:MAG: vitamin K epoxide reductase family protein [archaeon]
MKNKTKYQILLVLFLISLASSIFLSTQKQDALCGIGDDCDIVKNSQYNYTLGLQNSYYGIVIFSFLSVLTFLQIKKPEKRKENIIKISVIIGSIIVFYFLYIQKFVLNAFCRYCLVVDFSVLIALFIVLLKWEK